MENKLPRNTTAPEITLGIEELILREVTLLAFPASDWEKATYDEVFSLPRVMVTRPSEMELIAAEMVPYDCHTNCSNQAANDTSGMSRHVFGWMICGQDFVLHSVAEIGGEWFCLTPQTIEAASRFEFTPDPQIEWLQDDTEVSLSPYRCGVKLPEALRKHPEQYFKMRDEFLRLVASGMPVVDARKEVASIIGG